MCTAHSTSCSLRWSISARRRGGRRRPRGRRRGGGATISASLRRSYKTCPTGRTCRRRGAPMAAPPPRRCGRRSPPAPLRRGLGPFAGGCGDDVERGQARQAEGGERVGAGEEALGALAAQAGGGATRGVEPGNRLALGVEDARRRVHGEAAK